MTRWIVERPTQTILVHRLTCFKINRAYFQCPLAEHYTPEFNTNVSCGYFIHIKQRIIVFTCYVTF